jgi:hypothetical protein
MAAMGRSSSKLRAACGLLGPAAFTAAWIVSGRRQEGYSIRNEHISGLAAPDARDPHVMTGGFVALGAGTITFAYELDRRLGGPRRAGLGPSLMAGAGVCTLLAAMLRRDRMANVLPGERGQGGRPYRQSRANDGHDIASIAGQACTVLAQLALARRFRGDPEWGDLWVPAVASAALTGSLGLYFAAETARPGNGIVQRFGLTIALAGMATLAIRLLGRTS